MLIDPISFVKAAIGDEGFEELRKNQIFRESTNTVVIAEELDAALRIVPKALLAYLVQNLRPMEQGEDARLEIPGHPECYIQVTKQDSDVYLGQFIKEGKLVHNFKNSTIPNIGTHLVTYFEMYDRIIENEQRKQPESIDYKIQRMIEEKMALRDLVSKVVDQKLQEKDAIQQMVMNRIASSLTIPEESSVTIEVQEETEDEELELDKKENKASMEPHRQKLHDMRSRLSEINRSSKKISKSEVVVIENKEAHCPDCDKKIFTKNEGYSGCVCFGEDMKSKIYMTKTEDGNISLRFPKKWNPDNVKMFLEILDKKS